MASQYATSSVHHLRTGALIHGVSAPRAKRWKVARRVAWIALVILVVAAVACAVHASRVQAVANIAMLALTLAAPGMLAVPRASDWFEAAARRVTACRARRRLTSHLIAAIRGPRADIAARFARVCALARHHARAVSAAVRAHVRVPHTAILARTTARGLSAVGYTAVPT